MMNNIAALLEAIAKSKAIAPTRMARDLQHPGSLTGAQRRERCAPGAPVVLIAAKCSLFTPFWVSGRTLCVTAI